MTPEQLAELKNDATLRKRLAKRMAHDKDRKPDNPHRLRVI